VEERKSVVVRKNLNVFVTMFKNLFRRLRMCWWRIRVRIMWNRKGRKRIIGKKGRV
jgi:hypothetical protein